MAKPLEYVAAACLLMALATACRVEEVDSGPRANRPDRYLIGRAPASTELASIDGDVNASGAGLPAGSGTPQQGSVVFAQKCAICHGLHGEGLDKNPKLIGREPPAGFNFAGDVKAPRTIGNYWPYSTTIYDYLHRAMPLNAPGSLTPNELYALTAYLLSENGIIPHGMVMDARSLPAVRMPARGIFVRDDRTGGAPFR